MGRKDAKKQGEKGGRGRKRAEGDKAPEKRVNHSQKSQEREGKKHHRKGTEKRKLKSPKKQVELEGNGKTKLTN